MSEERRDTFVCEVCGGTFDCGWTDEEATAELSANFPGTTPDGCGLVCDDCYKNPDAPWAPHVSGEAGRFTGMTFSKAPFDEVVREYWDGDVFFREHKSGNLTAISRAILEELQAREDEIVYGTSPIAEVRGLLNWKPEDE